MTYRLDGRDPSVVVSDRLKFCPTQYNRRTNVLDDDYIFRTRKVHTSESIQIALQTWGLMKQRSEGLEKEGLNFRKYDLVNGDGY